MLHIHWNLQFRLQINFGTAVPNISWELGYQGFLALSEVD